MKIVLIHGLSRTSLSLLGLEWYLQQKGCKTEQFSYFACAESFESIVSRILLRLQTIRSQGSYGIVAHSLGGLLARVALGYDSVKSPEHIVMLGTPNQRPRLALHAWQLPPFRWWTGECGFNLTSQKFFASLPSLRSSYTIVARTKGITGVWNPFGNELNDGVVAVSETRLCEEDAIIQLPVWHTFMMNNSDVQKAVGQAFELEN